jgi:hypothetical protein
LTCAFRKRYPPGLETIVPDVVPSTAGSEPGDVGGTAAVEGLDEAGRNDGYSGWTATVVAIVVFPWL